MTGEVARASEPVLDDSLPGAAPRVVSAQRCQSHAQVPGGRRAELISKAPARSPVIGNRDDGRDVIGDATQCCQRRGQAVTTPQCHYASTGQLTAGQGLRTHSRPKSRWKTLTRIPSARSWRVSSCARATLRCRPPVHPTATVT